MNSTPMGPPLSSMVAGYLLNI
uniref:Uncharacterized protein n=1 Tax=Tetranychus urticae TaxID=32264 RepID=T1KQC3_TETUR